MKVSKDENQKKTDNLKTHSQLLLELWQEARTRLTNQLTELTTEDLKKTLSPSPNSVGFLLRHIAEVELLFAKNVFKAPGITVHAATLIAKHDTGEWNNLTALKDFLGYAFESLKEIIEIQVFIVVDIRVKVLFKR